MCELIKKLDQFSRCRRAKDGRQDRCKACDKLHHAEVYKAHKDRWVGYNRTPKQIAVKKAWGQRNCQQLTLKAYGLTIADYDAMLLAQGGCCAICEGAPSGRGVINNRFCVDHDHATGLVRGLLCHHCNAGLGSFRDSQTLLASAIEYLKIKAVKPAQ